ncbi:MAG: FHA domain-containing protein [Myxococcota bacterium]
MSEPGLLLRIERVPPGSLIERGPPIAVHGPSVTLGRSSDADVVFMDPSVSRRHVRIDLGPPIQIEALTASNGTFLDEVSLTPGRPITLDRPGAKLQLGGVIIALLPIGETLPVLDVIRDAPTTDTLIEVVWDAGQCLVRCGGQPLRLPPTPSKMLGILAEKAGEVVHKWDLQQELGSAQLAPHATAIRHAFARACQAGSVDLDRVRELRATQEPEADGDAPLDDVMRWLVQVRRDHGYILNLPADAITVRRV